MSKAVDVHGKPYNRIMLIIVLLVGVFCTVLNQTILTTAFPTLMNAFNISTSTVQWLTTGFLMVNGVMIPVSAYLSNRFPTKWLYIVAMVVFEIGTIVAWIAPSFAVLFAGRLIQAVGVGVTMPLLQTIMLTIFPAERRGTAMGMAGIVVGLAPALGPSLSGWVIDNFSWRDLFGMIVPIMAIAIIGSFFFMKDVIETSNPKLDYWSLVLSTAGFGSMLYGFSTVGDKGWSDPEVIWTIVIGVVLVALFVVRQLRIDTPFVEMRVFKSFQFSLATVLSSIVMMAMVGVGMIVPLYLQIVHGMSAFHSGLTMLPGALMVGIMSPVTGTLFDKYGARRLAMCGMFLLTVSTLPFVFLTRNTPIIYVVFLYAIRMFGISMVTMPITTYGMNALATNMISHGTAANNTIRQVATSVGTALLVSVLTNVTKNNMPAKGLLKQTPFEYKVKAINATMNGYQAAFWIAVGFCILGLLCTFLLPNENVISDEAKEVKGGAKA
ncbi:MDR family MFS transporter [Paucilactobacillus suebicus]|uniref:Major facilitator superfamily permease n=1 Tax=Paucilactobacillus suebicus DSM 5007 = KCTC 3549 TaxID=1423807 RepID=A0A0R1W562_9LACO|nr:MDR family MFS transporter [Paucilactobacillus suebicus]KRM12944.1 major facilitator superfamily permease [Paucilactobacillus suebicus DSM 5007 = KCTC 3549]